MGKQHYIAGLKKAISTPQQVLYKMQADYGNISTVFSGGTTNTGDIFSSYFNVARNCGATDNKDCAAPFKENYDGSGSTYDFNINLARYKFVNTDGMVYTIVSYNNSCNDDRGVNENSPTTKSCAYVYVDINGKNGPNYYGRDIFSF